MTQQQQQQQQKQQQNNNEQNRIHISIITISYEQHHEALKK
jgi:hypothetical protein